MLETNRLSLKSSGYLVVLGMFCKQIPCCLLWFEQVFTVAELRVLGRWQAFLSKPKTKTELLEMIPSCSNLKFKH